VTSIWKKIALASAVIGIITGSIFIFNSVFNSPSLPDTTVILEKEHNGYYKIWVCNTGTKTDTVYLDIRTTDGYPINRIRCIGYQVKIRPKTSETIPGKMPFADMHCVELDLSLGPNDGERSIFVYTNDPSIPTVFAQSDITGELRIKAAPSLGSWNEEQTLNDYHENINRHRE